MICSVAKELNDTISLMARRKKSFKRKVIFFLVFLSIVGAVVATVFFGLGFYLSPQNELKKADAIVVVSGGQTTTRAGEGIKLYQQGWAPKIIFSGAAMDDGPSNAMAMKAQALAAGVPDNAIEVDEDAQNTYQNAVNSKRIIEGDGASSASQGKTIILVTSPYHQRRSAMTFAKIFGPSYTILNHSSVDNRWSKSHWYESGFSRDITLAELRKLLYILITNNYQ